MLDNEPQNGSADAGTAASRENVTENPNPGAAEETPARRTTRRRATSATGTASAGDTASADGTAARPARSRARKTADAGTETGADETTTTPRATRRTRRTAAPTGQDALEFDAPASDSAPAAETAPAEAPAPERTRRRRSASTSPFSSVGDAPATARPGGESETEVNPPARAAAAPITALFVAPVVEEAPPRTAGRGGAPARSTAGAGTGSGTGDDGGTPRSRSRRRGRRTGEEPSEDAAATVDATGTADEADDEEDDEEELPGESAAARRRRRRGRRGRGRGKGPHDEPDSADDEDVAEDTAEVSDTDGESDADAMTRRRRKRRRRGAGGDETESEEGVVTVVKIREPRQAGDEVQGVSGSTRLEAKRQRRRDGREQRRTRPAILSESEFLARREAVERVMAIRQKGDRTQIAVLEDGILVEHYVTRASSGTMVGNVYLGKVQNVLPSMEAAFVDIGRGRNAVLYAGEVNWDMAGLEGRARSIEQALKAGDPVLVQVTKDPIGHKGARLTSHVALSGRHLVYVPNGHTSGISRKLSDVERKRLRDILKKLIPESAGVIVRTAAEGASEEDLSRDVTRLQAQWSDIEAKVKSGNAPAQLYEEPDLVIRVVRDLFNEDFRELVVQGRDAYDMVDSYLSHVSPDLMQRLRQHTGTQDIFATYRIDEQILKGLDRKVFLPSGGSLVIDRTEAMTVIDVNTGKYTGTGGNLEETVTRNNLEAAEEIVRQLRLRDLGGIIVIDFIDMVLESNRELVLRRLTECLGRDRTKHQVTEITSLGLVQMTRKRIGQGLLEAFSDTCEHCKGRGVILHLDPIPEKRAADQGGSRDAAPPRDGSEAAEPSGRRRGRRGRGGTARGEEQPSDADLSSVGETAEAMSGADQTPGVGGDADELVDEEVPDASDADLVDPGASATATVPPVATTNGYAASAPTPAPSGWVNLGDAPPIGSGSASNSSNDAAPASGTPDSESPSGGAASTGTALQPVSDFAQVALPEVDALESESDETAHRRRGARWRLRP
jgi:ribonuclease E